ncbi:MAG: adenylate/guanylate cyclase domain-containing protein, partial [Gammaproteobacteria bacterium]|nr:adenylate/guanylate cyclase domain-containing protein [Gammaproteobacteria bacterium]
FFTPFSSDLKEDTGISGPAMHAHIASQLVRMGLNGDQPIKTLSDFQERLWVITWCLFGAIIGIWISSVFYYSLISFMGVFVLAAVNYLGFGFGYWVPLGAAVIGWLTTISVTTAYISYFEKNQKNQLMHIFSKYVSSEVADAIWESKDLLLEDGRLQSKKLMATVFFTDLQGFTAVSEQWEPEFLMDWLNDYMDKMAMVVIQHHGVVDDYFGDAIKANFGLPIPRVDYYEIRNDVINAIDCALEMARIMDELNIQWHENGLPSMRMRIGINTGEVVAGSLGSSERMKYTSVGDVVNTAARLESLKREEFAKDGSYGTCRILVSDTTLNYVTDLYEATLIDTISLKGKQEKVTVYQINSAKVNN